jgi:hypothetical protein
VVAGRYLSTFSNLAALGVRDRVRCRSVAPNDFRSVLTAIAQLEPDEVYNLSGQSSVGLSFEQAVETMESVSVAIGGSTWTSIPCCSGRSRYPIDAANVDRSASGPAGTIASDAQASHPLEQAPVYWGPSKACGWRSHAKVGYRWNARHEPASGRSPRSASSGCTSSGSAFRAPHRRRIAPRTGRAASGGQRTFTRRVIALRRIGATSQSMHRSNGNTIDNYQ